MATAKKSTKTEFAGFWIRLGAYALDQLLLFVFFLVTSFMLGAILYGVIGVVFGVSEYAIDSFIDSRLYEVFFLLFLGIPITALYYTYMIGSTGQTLGKKALGIKVVTANSEPLGYKKAFVRYVGYIVSGMALGLGYIWIIIDKDKQGLHDKIAKTYVVKVK